MEFGRLGDSRVRGPGEVPVYRHGPFFSTKSKNNGVRKCSGPQKLLCADPFWYFGAETEWQGPISRGCFGSAKAPPGSSLFRRLPPRERSAFSRATEHGGLRGPLFPGDVEVGKSGDLAKDREEKDDGRRGKKMTEERGKKEDDGGRKKKIDGGENHFI